MKDINEGFEKLVQDPDLLIKVSENVGSSTDYPLAPQGLRVYWNTLCKYNGWRLQKNYYYNHCRILDEYNVRRAWGQEKDMVSALETIAGLQ
ncbi:MAG TPA: hypothetical protein VM577_16770 [Anaerovoracaceae bacterium]|nr:hypothetical protein [Anaerovoracaceae bacterium]